MSVCGVLGLAPCHMGEPKIESQVHPVGQTGYPISLVASLDTVPVTCCVPLLRHLKFKRNNRERKEVLRLFRRSTHTHTHAHRDRHIITSEAHRHTDIQTQTRKRKPDTKTPDTQTNTQTNTQTYTRHTDKTQYFPVLLRTTKLAHSTSQYYFVLPSWHTVLPSTTSYYKACTQYFPVLLRTTRLTQKKTKSQFCFSFWRSNLISCDKVAAEHWKSQFYHSFWRSNLVSCEVVAPNIENRNFTAAFDDRTSFRAKGLRRTRQNRNDDRTSFRAKGLRRTRQNRNDDRTSFRAKRVAAEHWKSQFYHSFWRSNLVSCEVVAPNIENRNFFAAFDDRTSFRAKGLRRTRQNRNDDRTSFRAKGLLPNIDIAILPQFLTIEPHFVRKGCAGPVKIAMTIEPRFVRSGCAEHWKSQFYRSFWRSNLVSCERVAPDPSKSQWRSNLVSCERVAPDPSKSQWRSNLVSCEKGCRRTLKIAILPQFLTIEPRFVRSGCAEHWKSQFFRSFWRSNLVSCERVAPDPSKSQWRSNLVSCERVAAEHWHRNFTAVFDDRTSFRAKGLHFVAPRWHCPPPYERNGKEGERRGQEGKRARRQEREDVKMRRCEDVKMRRCNDEKL